MTLYVGETTRVRSTAKNFDDLALTPADVTSVDIEISKKADDSVVVSTTAMSWDGTHLYWYYDWNTTSEDPGTYRAQVKIIGALFQTWEYKDIRLKANP